MINEIYSASDGAITTFILIFGNLLFMIFLVFAYFSKKKVTRFRTKFYRVMIVIATLILINKTASCLTVEVYGITTKIFLLFHFCTCGFLFSWFVMFYFHTLCYYEQLEYKSVFQFLTTNKKAKIFSVFCILVLIGFFFVPGVIPDIDTISTHIGGLSEYYLLGVLAIIMLWINIEIFLLMKKIPLKRKLPTIALMVALVLVLVGQLLLSHVPLYQLIPCISVYFIFFTMENPDIVVIEELNIIKNDIDKSNSAKTDFLSNMSLEIKTPMNAINGFSDMLLNSPYFNEDKSRNDLRNIAISGNNLIDIINNILDMSNFESNSSELVEVDYDMGTLLNEIINVVRTRLSLGTVELVVELSPSIPSKYRGDANKISQALLNILNNAVKTTDVGKIVFSIEPDVVDDDIAILQFKITDTGTGFKKEDQDNLLNKFKQIDDKKDVEMEETNLGLVIAKQNIELMDGNIWFESEFGAGTSFYINLPQKVLDPSPIKNLEKNASFAINNTFIDCSKFNALIVDDNLLNIKATRRLLKKYGFTVDFAENGQDCIYKLKQGYSYDIIFMDTLMPNMSGFDVLNIINKLENLNIPPIVALTADAVIGAREKYLSSGFTAYLAKPTNIGELDKIIHALFDRMMMSSSLGNRKNPEIEEINEPIYSNVQAPSVMPVIASRDEVLDKELEEANNLEVKNTSAREASEYVDNTSRNVVLHKVNLPNNIDELSVEDVQSVQDASGIVGKLVEDITPLINMIPNINFDGVSDVESDSAIDIDLVKLSINIDPNEEEDNK